MSPIRERRIAALKIMARFCAKHGFAEPPYRFQRGAGGIIAVIGVAPDGREFGIGYPVRGQ